MLYWAEGAKRKTSLIFVNSDADMMVLFTRFLREEMRVANEDIVIHILLHTRDAETIRQQEQFWLDTLSLDKTSLKKTVYKTGNPLVRHNKLANGVCHLGVYRVAVVQHIFGAIQQYAGISKPSWLD